MKRPTIERTNHWMMNWEKLTNLVGKRLGMNTTKTKKRMISSTMRPNRKMPSQADHRKLKASSELRQTALPIMTRR